MAEVASVAVVPSRPVERLARVWHGLPLIVRYGCAGGVTQVVYLTVLALGLSLHVHYLFALAAAQVAAMSFAFPAYRGLVFEAEGSWRRQVAAFLGVWWTGAALSFTGVPLLVEAFGLNALVAQLLVLSVVVTASFLAHSNLTFRRPRT